MFLTFLSAAQKAELQISALGGYQYNHNMFKNHTFVVGTELATRMLLGKYFFYSAGFNLQYAPVKADVRGAAAVRAAGVPDELAAAVEDIAAQLIKTRHYIPLSVVGKFGGGARGFSAYAIASLGYGFVVGGGFPAAKGFCFSGGAGVEYKYKKFGVFAELLAGGNMFSNITLWNVRGVAGVSLFI